MLWRLDKTCMQASSRFIYVCMVWIKYSVCIMLHIGIYTCISWCIAKYLSIFTFHLLHPSYQYLFHLSSKSLKNLDDDSTHSCKKKIKSLNHKSFLETKSISTNLPSFCSQRKLLFYVWRHCLLLKESVLQYGEAADPLMSVPLPPCY